jgi:hypothetical protein
MRGFVVVWLAENLAHLTDRWFSYNNEGKRICRFEFDNYKRVSWFLCEEVEGLRFSLSGSLNIAGLQYRWTAYFDYLDISDSSFSSCMARAMTTIWEQIKDSLTSQLLALQEYAIANLPEYEPAFTIAVGELMEE